MSASAGVRITPTPAMVSGRPTAPSTTPTPHLVSPGSTPSTRTMPSPRSAGQAGRESAGLFVQAIGCH